MYQAEQFLDALAHALAQWPVLTPVNSPPPDGPLVHTEIDLCVTGLGFDTDIHAPWRTRLARMTDERSNSMRPAPNPLRLAPGVGVTAGGPVAAVEPPGSWPDHMPGGMPMGWRWSRWRLMAVSATLGAAAALAVVLVVSMSMSTSRWTLVDGDGAERLSRTVLPLPVREQLAAACMRLPGTDVARPSASGLSSRFPAMAGARTGAARVLRVSELAFVTDMDTLIVHGQDEPDLQVTVLEMPDRRSGEHPGEHRPDRAGRGERRSERRSAQRVYSVDMDADKQSSVYVPISPSVNLELEVPR